MKEPVQIIKLGGKIIMDGELLRKALISFAVIPGKKILIHGGAGIADQWMKKLNVTPKMYEGRRITDDESLEIVTMVYAGLINKRIVSQLQGLSCNAIGISGADGNLIRARKRQMGEIDYGFAGDVEEVNIELLEWMLDRNLAPVICAITHDAKGQLLNTNADTITGEIGAALSDNHRVVIKYCFEFNGVLRDKNDPFSTFDSLSAKEVKAYIESGVLSDGMIPKINNALRVAAYPVEKVLICGIENLSLGKGATLITP